MSSEVRASRARLAAATRHHPDDNHDELKAELKAANLAAYVERTVADAPPLTDEQRDRIAALLKPA